LSSDLKPETVFSQVVMFRWFQVVREFVDEGFARGYLKGGNVLVGDVVEVLDERAQAVAVGRYDDPGAQ
jgi:hypothetical protein